MKQCESCCHNISGKGCGLLFNVKTGELGSEPTEQDGSCNDYEPKDVGDKECSSRENEETPITYIYPCWGGKTEVVITNSREKAAQYIEKGYELVAVPQMFGEKEGTIVLIFEQDEDDSAFEILELYEEEARKKFPPSVRTKAERRLRRE